MTKEVVEAILTLAAAAKARADAATPGPWETDLHTVVGPGGMIAETARSPWDLGACIANAAFVASCRQDVPDLADTVRLLVDELLVAWAILSDATSESAMHRHGYAQGVRDSLAAVEAIHGPPYNEFRAAAAAVRALLPE